MHETVLGFDESVHFSFELQRAHHRQSVERKLFEEFAIALGIRAQIGVACTTTRTAGHERRAHAARRVRKTFVRFDFGQRRDHAAGFFLGRGDVLIKILIFAGATAQHSQRQYRDGRDANQTR